MKHDVKTYEIEKVLIYYELISNSGSDLLAMNLFLQSM